LGILASAALKRFKILNTGTGIESHNCLAFIYFSAVDQFSKCGQARSPFRSAENAFRATDLANGFDKLLIRYRYRRSL